MDPLPIDSIIRSVLCAGIPFILLFERLLHPCRLPEVYRPIVGGLAFFMLLSSVGMITPGMVVRNIGAMGCLGFMNILVAVWAFKK